MKCIETLKKQYTTAVTEAMASKLHHGEIPEFSGICLVIENGEPGVRWLADHHDEEASKTEVISDHDDLDQAMGWLLDLSKRADPQALVAAYAESGLSYLLEDIADSQRLTFSEADYDLVQSRVVALRGELGTPQLALCSAA